MQVAKPLLLVPANVESYIYGDPAENLIKLIVKIEPIITEIMDSDLEMPAHHKAQIHMIYKTIEKGKELILKGYSWNMPGELTFSMRIKKIGKELKDFLKSPILINILVDFHYYLQGKSDQVNKRFEKIRELLAFIETEGRGMVKVLLKLAEPTMEIESNNTDDFEKFVKDPAENLNKLIVNIEPIITEIMDSDLEMPAHHEAQIDMIYKTIEKGKELIENGYSWHIPGEFITMIITMRIQKIEKELKDLLKSPILINILVDFHHLQGKSDQVNKRLEKIRELLASNETEGRRMVKIPRKLVETTMEIESNNTDDFEKFRAGIEEWEFQYVPLRFTYEELSIATNEFEEEQLLGRGGFGQVYKGKLPGSDAKIAVKRTSHDSSQGMKEFLAEISTIGCLKHPNLVRLLGYCKHKDELFLVYDYMPNGSLDKFINRNGNQEWLSWEQRFKIIKDVASALLYMHQEWKQVIIHRDIKPANILIDHEMNARLGDFGLAKLSDHGFDPQTSKVAGTFGYMAPEIYRTRKVTTSTDVYAFGVVMLEVVCGRRVFEESAKEGEEVLGDWILELWKKRQVIDAAEDSIRQEENKGQIELVLKLGVLCSHHTVSIRPNMSKVMRILNGDSKLPVNLPYVLRREKLRARLVNTVTVGFCGRL